MSILDKWPLANAASIKQGIAAGLQGKNRDAVATTSTDPALRNRNYAVIIQQERDIGEGAGKGPKTIVGTVPESFEIAQASEFDVPWGAGLAGDGMLGNLSAVLTGNRLIGQVMTMRVWQGSGNDFTFTVTFELRAWSNPATDVVQPLRDLIGLTLPSLDSTGFLQSPGPILDAAGVAAISGSLTGATVKVAKAAADAIPKIAQATTVDGTTQVIAESSAKIKEAASGLASKKEIEGHLRNKIRISIGRWFFLDNVVVLNVQHEIKPQTPHRDTGLFQAASVTVTFAPMFALTTADIDSMFAIEAFANLADNKDKRKTSPVEKVANRIRGALGV
jgi:hypothetical protein